jgi:hypothetical protein
MEDSASNGHREEFFSRVVRAGKRTYFFDVKQTRGKEMYLTVTESKRLFDNATGKFYYEKHKIFLYKEDFEKFANGLNAVIEFIETGKAPDPDPSDNIDESGREKNLHDLAFDDLDEDERIK